jgi:hypothetical protein
VIERILGRDFQNHRRVKVDLDPHVTILVGPSGAGKSALIRLLRWVLTNRPLGDSFVGRWRKAPFALGKVWLDGNRTITRTRGAGVNTYKLDGVELKAFGQGIPRPVADLANVGPANFQGQHAGPFWLSLPPSEVSRALNEIVNLDSIDRALAKASAEVREKKVLVKLTRNNWTAAKARRDRAGWAKQLHEQIITTESLILKNETHAKRRLRLGELAARGTETRQTADLARGAILSLRNGLSRLRIAHQRTARYERLGQLVDQLSKHSVLARSALPDPAALTQLRKSLDRAAHSRQQMAAIVFGVENQSWEADECHNQIRKCEKSLDSLSGTRCPACRQPLPRYAARSGPTST